MTALDWIAKDIDRQTILQNHAIATLYKTIEDERGGSEMDNESGPEPTTNYDAGYEAGSNMGYDAGHSAGRSRDYERFCWESGYATGYLAGIEIGWKKAMLGSAKE